jgi:hypothetical protein
MRDAELAAQEEEVEDEDVAPAPEDVAELAAHEEADAEAAYPAADRAAVANQLARLTAMNRQLALQQGACDARAADAAAKEAKHLERMQQARVHRIEMNRVHRIEMNRQRAEALAADAVAAASAEAVAAEAVAAELQRAMWENLERRQLIEAEAYCKIAKRRAEGLPAWGEAPADVQMARERVELVAAAGAEAANAEGGQAMRENSEHHRKLSEDRAHRNLAK